MSKSLEALRQRLRSGDPEPEGMIIDYPDLVPLTAGELREACNANPNHPVAKDLLKGVTLNPPMADSHKIYCERADVVAVLDNRESAFVVTKEKMPDGSVRMTRRKSVIGEPTSVVNQPKRSTPAASSTTT